MSFAAFYKQTLVACSLLLCSFSANADAPSLNLTLSHTDTSELKPIAPFKIARAQFLPDINDNPYSFFDRIEEDHNRGDCNKNGFQYTRSNCPAPRILKNKCPFSTSYAECYCAGSPTCSGSKNHTSNPYPSSTGASETSCRNCIGDTLYNWSCNSSTCSAYMIYGSCPSHGNCSRCCDGYYKLNSCDSGYEISGSGGQAKCILSETCFGDTSRNSELGYSCSSCVNKSGQTLYTCSCTGSCSLSSCPSNGNCSTDCKGKYCLNSCKSGYSVSGNTCVKDCVPNDCSAYPLASAPVNAEYETCSVGCESNITKYRFKSCKLGYIENNQTCTKCSKTETSCNSNKTLVNTCTNTSGNTVGDCVDCTNNLNPLHPCIGKRKCSSDTGSGLCECGDQKFFDDCTCSLASCPEKGTCTQGLNGKYCLDSCDNGYRKSGDICVCVPDECNGFDLSSRPEHAAYETCSPGCGLSTKYKITSCDAGYTLSGNACTCTPKDCSEYPLYTQPANASFETCTPGCGLPSKYRIATCNAGYYLEGTGCAKCDRVNTRCDTGKTLVNTCQMANGATVGDCVDCRDESSPYNPCYGYYICEGDKEGSGTTCNCGSQTYYEKCLVKETCTYKYRPEESCPGKIWDRSINACEYGTGNHPAGDTCVALDGKTYFESSWVCTLSSNPCKGFKSSSDCKAAGGFDTSSEKCECGGIEFYKQCKETCTYKYRPEESCPGKIWDRSINACEYGTGNHPTGNTCVALDGKTYFERSWVCTLSSNPCHGFKSSSDCKAAGGFDTSSEKCECGGIEFYKQCKETCTYKYRPEESCPGKIWDRSINACEYGTGNHPAGNTCVALDGKTYFESSWVCTLSSNPCKGFKSSSDCPGKIVGGETCECGGKTFGSVCLTACNYEDTPATCSAKGMTFTLKCSDESGNQFGECS